MRSYSKDGGTQKARHKRMRQSVALAGTLLLFAAPIAVQGQFDYVTNNGAIMITQYTGTNADVDIPATINGLPVTSIGDAAFFGSTSLISVTIPNSVNSIGGFAFAECGLTNAMIPDSVTSVGDNAFRDCTSLTGATVGDGVTNLGDGVFAECSSLSSVTILNNLISIGGPAILPMTGQTGTFADCINLTSINIPSSVTSIGVLVFSGCTNLTSVSIPDSVTNIGDYAFADTGLRSVTIPNGVTSIGDSAFVGCASLITVSIPDSVTNLGFSAFRFCTGLTTVTIGSGVTSIGRQAFEECTNVTTVRLGGSVTNFDFDDAFEGCYNVTAINVDAASLTYSSVGGVLFKKSQTTLIRCPPGKAGSYTISGSVKNIADYSFLGCINLTSVAIPDGVTIIGDAAFAGCGLTNVTIPDSVISIGGLAFADCYGLTAINVATQNPAYSSINGVLFNKSQTEVLEFPGGLAGSYTIPNSVSTIGDYAFSACPSLTNVTIPDGVTSIGEGAFGDCLSLTRVFFVGNAPNVGSFVFYSNVNEDPTTIFHLPGTLGWSNTFAGRPTALWFLPQPLILSRGPDFGVRSNQFGFTISWATNVPVVVEVATNLSNPVWVPVATNTLTSGTSSFTDAAWTNFPQRFYRAASP